jgi:hypothetical protein
MNFFPTSGGPQGPDPLTWDFETESVAEKLGTPQTHEVAALTAEDR